MERHGYRVKNEVATVRNKTTLHQLTAINGTITLKEQVVIGFSYHQQAIANRTADVHVNIDPAHHHLRVMAQERVNRCQTHLRLDSLNNKQRTMVATDAMCNPNVIDESALYPTGNGRNGVVVISTTEEQVPLPQRGKILSLPR